MTDETKLQTLRASRLAADLSEDECRVLSDLVDVRDLADGEVLVREGMADNRLHVIASGTLGIVKNPDTDARVTVATLDAGELAGELGFIDGALRQSSLVATGSTRVLSLEREKLESLLTTNPMIVYHVMRAIIRTVHQIQRRLSLQAVELSNYVYKQHGRY
jgi:CRP/FNR family transcriptional regulator, cyclic AMP receptor protein